MCNHLVQTEVPCEIAKRFNKAIIGILPLRFDHLLCLLSMDKTDSALETPLRRFQIF